MKNLIKNIVARVLWETQAVKISVDKPFLLVSGNYSPIYINCRGLISNPVAIDLISAFIHWWCVNHNIDVDIIAGGETAGIPFAAFVAQRLSKPMVYVRKKPKGHGMGSSVEGSVDKGQRVLLIEDLITDGGSKEGFILGLRDAGATVEHCIVVFDRQQGGEDFLKELGVNLHALCTMDVVLKSIIESGSISEDQEKEIQQYLIDQESWHKKRGLEYKIR